MTAAGPAPGLVDLSDRLRLDRAGRPRCGDAEAIVEAIDAVSAIGEEATNELVLEGFLRDSGERYEAHVASQMCSIPGASFVMGTPQTMSAHYCGEAPEHEVGLSSFSVSRYAVTNDLFALFDPGMADAGRSVGGLPVVGVTWFDAYLFAAWMGCRLPTEAEWEFACGAGSPSEWACDGEEALVGYGWYSENSGGEIHRSATLAPNRLGLFDLHGNVWEWCQDRYDQDWYSRSAAADPQGPPPDPTRPQAHRVCRGGSVHALAEMCRTRFRYHEPPRFWARDLGFRLAGPAGD